jgi:hypothetical protein
MVVRTVENRIHFDSCRFGLQTCVLGHYKRHECEQRATIANIGESGVYEFLKSTKYYLRRQTE